MCGPRYCTGTTLRDDAREGEGGRGMSGLQGAAWKISVAGELHAFAARTLIQRPSTAALSAIFTLYCLTRAQVGRGHSGPLPPVVSSACTPAGPGRRRLRRFAGPVHRQGQAAALDEIGAAHLAPRRYRRPTPRSPLPGRNRRPAPEPSVALARLMPSYLSELGHDGFFLPLGQFPDQRQIRVL